MKRKSIFVSADGVRIAIEIDSIERTAFFNLYGLDVCTSKYRMIRLLDLLNSLRAYIALYKTPSKRFDSGCITILSEDTAGWSIIKNLCNEKGLNSDEECIHHVLDIITQFIHDIISFQWIEMGSVA
ncbi:hypothetical protein QPL79_06385 [Ignisphaera sp. 4213-co]|uniref:Uncharacterized protein n=1 Tax=Ignisphaera cupida TaxID=3050454 RepID=A0ABD4Z6N5_9CREN|nr:hypothetical protein [Ignisphaera sp. 4213-co]MDK6028987.1 hypothetical protein [Ignisphaera sp. 4213-co]